MAANARSTDPIIALIACPSPVQSRVNQLAQVLTSSGFRPALTPGPVAPIYLQTGLESAPQPPEAWQWVSPIALQLAGEQRATAADIASQLARASNRQLWSTNPSPASPDSNGLVTVLANGWLAWPISTTTIAHWLQQQLAAPPRLVLPPTPQPSEATATRGGLYRGELAALPLWQLQYAYVRCGSLLQLAQREGWLELAKINQNWQIVAPAQFPWLDRHQNPDNPRLWLQHPAELALLQQLFQFPGCLSSQRLSWGYSQSPNSPLLNSSLANSLPPDWLTPVPLPSPTARPASMLHTLGTTFEQFYRHCRIWGDVRAHTPELSLARLGLLAVLRSILEFTLVTWLGITPPEEW